MEKGKRVVCKFNVIDQIPFLENKIRRNKVEKVQDARYIRYKRCVNVHSYNVATCFSTCCGGLPIAVFAPTVRGMVWCFLLRCHQFTRVRVSTRMYDCHLRQFQIFSLIQPKYWLKPIHSHRPTAANSNIPNSGIQTVFQHWIPFN